MNRVQFQYKSGRVKMVSSSNAELLQRLGQGTYLTRDMRAARAVVDDGLDRLDASALRKIAEDRGVKVHHKAGADKIRAALREAK